MRKMDHLAIKDILRKRQVRSLNPSFEESSIVQPTLWSSHKELTIQAILQKIHKTERKNNQLLQLTTEEKYVIIEFMSERENISYNRSSLAGLMNVWACGSTVTWVSPEPDPPQKYSFDKSPHQQKLSLKNFFLLAGQVSIFDYIPQPEREKNPDDDDLIFETQSKPQKIEVRMEGVQPKIIVQEHTGWGPIFRKKEEDHIPIPVFKLNNCIVVEVENPEFEGMLVNLGGMDQERKCKILEHFPIFSTVSKKIMPILPYIGLKRFTKNQYIYKMKQVPEAVYLILKGQIVFEVKVESGRQRKDKKLKNYPNQFLIQTEALGIGNYFGEEEILLRTNRKVNTICSSAECDLLEIPAEKFEKLLGYSDFYEELRNAADIKMLKRKEKLQKSATIYEQFSKSPQKQIQENEIEDRKTATLDNRNKSTKKKMSEPIKVMHGNVIRKIPNRTTQEQVNFSMLGANPDMYQATLKKFRKYTMKAPEKYKPEVNWNMKRVWKVLNLQSILRQDAQVSSPQGRKFYESHRRLQNHVQEVKSLRPKTSSSTYRTKLQYIAYLQQFNN